MANIKILFLILGMTFHRQGSCSNFCYQCESTNGNLPDCDNINPEDIKYEVDCTGGYCTKTTRLTNGSVVYVKRACHQYSSDITYTCEYVAAHVTTYDEIFCSCETSYCNESDWLTKLDLTLFCFVLTMGFVL